MEDDTPGQILGVTHKTDGKSGSFSSSSTKSESSSGKMYTQGPQQEYSAEDKSSTDEARLERDRVAQKPKTFFYIGVFIGMLIVCAMLSVQEQDEEMALVQKRLERENLMRAEQESFRDA